MKASMVASAVLAVVVAAAAGAQSAPAVSPAEARTGIQASYTEWAKARVALDMATIQRLLAPEFYFQLPDRKVTRQEFIDRVPSLKLTRFSETVLTVEPRDSGWSAVIVAKAEVEIKDKDGKTGKEYRVLVSRDDWRQVNDHEWALVSSEPLSQERWKDERPPIANW